MYDLIIIGGGPAGLTAAIYAIRKRLNVLLLSKDLGGKTNYRLALPWVEDYQVIRGLEIVNKFRTELEYLDFARHIEAVDKVEKKDDHFIVMTKGGAKLESKAVILATGTRQVRMEVPGEKEYTMKGLCYSALSYAPLFIDRSVIVIGDEELALRSAGELSTVAKEVTMVCANDKMLDSPLGHKLQQAQNVRIMKDCEIVEVQGDEYARKLIIKDKTGKLKEYQADGMFVEKALTPNTNMVKDLVELDNQGRIIVDGGCRTNVPGLFAAGDVTNSYAEQVLVAVGEGAKAALSAYDYLLPTL
ncbi:MAG TPA: FAD-dependent oxidoreductase [Anaerolineales bacterium]|nr:FAD-dependent oxidoreductase [Anaerolineales bacterium]HLE92120.1 FAD-dependent oxidoreductase [Anaerolineales bacterium]